MTKLPPAHVFLARQMRALTGVLAETIPRVRQTARGSAEDLPMKEEAIHDMRVAPRRLRVVLKIARPLFGRYHVETIRDAFTRVHRATGALRDEEVLRDTLGGLGVASAELDVWMARRALHEERLRALISQRLRAGDLRRPMRMLEALLLLPVTPTRRRSLEPFALKVVARAQTDVEKLSRADTGDAEALHALRIAYKRLRYSGEIFFPALPAELAATIPVAERFQKRLGEVHDLDVARAVVLRARKLPDVKARLLHTIATRRAERVDAYLELAGKLPTQARSA